MAKVRPTAEASMCRRNENPESIGSDDEIITINIAGERFQTLKSTLERFPNSILGCAEKRKKYWNPKQREYFLDRHRQSFESILYIYQSYGHVLRPETVPIYHFLNELKFYDFDSAVMASFWENEGYSEPPQVEMPTMVLQRKVWELVEYPDSSTPARIIGFFSIFMITLSCISFILETMPIFEDVNRSKTWSSPFYLIELVCSTWFLIEFTLRIISSPNKRKFVTTFGNILDFIAILPFFISFTWTLLSDGQRDDSFSVLRVFRLIRVIQIFKLSRHSIGLRVLGQTFKASMQEIILMGFFLVIALILFSSGMYFAENEQVESKFTSIPASFWFTLATITTVGFGDLVPLTPYGKIVGSVCALIGVLTLTFPISIIITNFKQYYRQAYRLASLNAEDLQRAAKEVREWREEEAQSGNRNDTTDENEQPKIQRPPQLFRKDIAPIHWLQSQGSMSSADDALYV